MKLILFHLLFLFSILNLNAQKSDAISTLTILGRHRYFETPQGFVATVIFVDDPTKCDPYRGYVPVPDQIKHFKEALIAQGLDTNQLHPDGKFEDAPYLNKRYKIIETKFERLEQILLQAKKMDLQIESIDLYYPDRTYSDQDDKAKLALENARQKATMIANHLGYRITRILNIDDDTRVTSIFDDSKPKDFQISPQLEQLLAELGDLFAGGEHSYTLRVTFELSQQTKND